MAAERAMPEREWKTNGGRNAADETILGLFRAQAGAFVSGEAISEALGVSRTAVWKHIQRLRRAGYAFESVRNRGYRLIAEPERYDPARFSSLLATEKLGRAIRWLEEVESTQDVAHALAREGAEEGTLVIAESQTSGRGRFGRRWLSPPGKGIWMSLILRPGIPLAHASQLTLLAAVSLCRTIRKQVGVEVGIKWPNDLLCSGRKVSGILLESSAEDERITHVVAGFGISANLVEADYPPDLRAKATSLRLESGRPVDRERLVAAFLLDLEQLYKLYETQGFAPIRTLWEALSVSLHRPIRVLTGAGEVEGAAEAIDDFGALHVRGKDGTVHKVYSGEVEI